MDDASCSSTSSNEGDDLTSNNDATEKEELVTRLQLCLTASHLPKKGRLKRRSPDSYATVASIVRKEGTGKRQTSEFHRNSRQHLKTTSSLSARECQGGDYMVEWGSTEVYVKKCYFATMKKIPDLTCYQLLFLHILTSIRNSRSPQWIETIPLEYEYGSELYFYVRILQAEENSDESKRQALSPQSGKVSSQGNSSTGFYGSPQKNRMAHCFGTALFEVGDILGSRNYTKVKRLKSGGWYV